MIPRVLHQIWVGEPAGPLPSAFDVFAQTWKEHHPGWSYVLWTSADQELRNADLIRRAHWYVPQASVGQFIADVMRYEILERFGGVYVDVDFECRRPIDDLLDGVSCFAAWERQDAWVNNAIMGAEPGAPFIERLVAGLPESVAAHPRARANVVSGPHYVTRLYREHPDELVVFDQARFYPYAFDELERSGEDFPTAYAVHHWANARRRRGKQL